MQRAASALALALALAVPALAQTPPAFRFSDAARADYPDEIRLGTGPGQPSEEWFRQDGALQVRNISEATLTPFLPDPGRAGTSSSDWIYRFHHWLRVNAMLERHP